MVLTVIGNLRGDIDTTSGLSAAGLPPLLLLGCLLDLVTGGPGVAVKQDVLLQGSVLVHALELGHRDDGLLALSSAAGAPALDIFAGCHGKLGMLSRCVDGRIISGCDGVNHREGSQRPEVGSRGVVVKVGQAQQSVRACESFSVKKE